MAYFKISKKAIDHLTNVDTTLGKFIKKRGDVKRLLYNTPLECLVSCVVAQQVSSKTAENIFKRIAERIAKFTPKKILNFGHKNLCECGISAKKADCIIEIVSAINSKKLDLKNLQNLSDSEIEEILTNFKGIGTWTVEMFLIFALQRPNVITKKDFGIRKGFSKLHNLTEFETYKTLYSPYATTASIYLWEFASA